MAHYAELDRNVLEQLYVTEGLSLKEVSERLGPPWSKRVVQRALELHGIPMRPARPPARRQALMSRELLERMYVDEGRSLPEVAASFGVAINTVIHRMEALGIDRRKGGWRSVGDRQPLTRALLQELRIDKRMSAGQIAEMLGYSWTQVISALKRHGMATRAEERRLAWRLDAAEYWHLHHRCGIPIKELARKLGTSVDAVTKRMHEVDVPTRAGNRHMQVPIPDSIPPPDLELIEDTFATAISRLPMPRTTSHPIEEATAEDLRRLHHDEQLGLTEIAGLYRTAMVSVKKRMDELGVDFRDRRGRRTGVAWQPDELRRLERLYERADVLDALDQCGVAVRAPGEHFEVSIDVTEPILKALYVDLGLTQLDIALLADRSPGAIGRVLRVYGFETRRQTPSAVVQAPSAEARATQAQQIDARAVATLAEEGVDPDEIAYRLGIPSVTTVRIILQILDLPSDAETTPPPMNEATVEAVRGSHVDAGHAAAVCDPRPRGVGGWKHVPHWPWPPDPGLLVYLYNDLGLSLVEVGARLRVSHDRLVAEVKAAGIQLRHTAEVQVKSRRWRLDREELIRLYVGQEWSSRQIGEHLGVSEATVLRALHRHHLPVVRTGQSDRRVRFDDLMADPRVGAALLAAGMQPAPANALNLRRPLHGHLVRTLLVDLRLSTFDVELLTGRVAKDVREDAIAHGIEVPDLPPGVTPEDLREAYLEKGWSQDRICEEFGIGGRAEPLPRARGRRDSANASPGQSVGQAPAQPVLMISETRLGELLAAIGNHEAKALTFLAMDDDVPYGVTSIYRRFIEIQGSPPAFAGQVTVAQKYLVHSFAPIGLVARQRNEGGFIRHVRDDPDGVATALAGFLLAATAHLDVSLQRIFGKTSAKEGTERSPIRRYRILNALAQTSADIHPAALSVAASVPEMPTSLALRSFADNGLLSFETSATYEMRTTYRVTRPVPPQTDRGGYRTAYAIGLYLNQVLADSNGEVVIPREQIEDYLRSKPRWREVGSLRDVVQSILKRFVERGYLETVTSHFGITHSRVSMTEEQRAFAARLTAGIQAIAAGDAQAIAAGNQSARQIINDPEAVRALIRRGFKATKNANDPMSEGERLRLTVDAVAKLPGGKTDELLVVADPRFSTQSLRAALSALAKRGEIVAVKQPDGPYRRYYPGGSSVSASRPP
ncbi:MAG: hypothetical protein ACT4P1_02925 [Sporichthyaceae bacterium]